MSSPGTRDHALGAETAAMASVVSKLQEESWQLMTHALRHGATAHAGLYTTVHSCLLTARQELDRAAELMIDGDPEDFAHLFADWREP